MNKKHILIILILISTVFTGCLSSDFTGNNINIDISTGAGIDYIQSCCYEVVILKPDEQESQITYEDDLPWDLVNINYRNDKYLSLGTAFAVSDSKLITATHVLDPYSDSIMFPQRFVRERRIDSNGEKIENVYEINQILSINNRKDYVVFNLKEKKLDHWLTIQNEYEFNTKIYTAGYALGEGLVIRDGILLDKIDESGNGEWQYLKSSIMTNPGNSGGPIMNSAGEVIGVVLSKKDDFCYSLPISEISENEGHFHQNLRFLFALMNENIRKDFDYDIEDFDSIRMPVYYQDYIKFHTEKESQNSVEGMEELFSKYKSETFPEGTASQYVLHLSNDTTFPQIILKDSDDKQWFFSSLRPMVEMIEPNGKIRYQQIYENANVWIIEINQNDNKSPFELFENPAELMDYFLEGVRFSRKLFNNDPGTRITSFGEPFKSEDLIDRYQRKWKLNAWLEEYSDSVLYMVSTPTPKGSVSLYLMCKSRKMLSYEYDMKKMLDFIDINYSGKITEWTDFLKRKDLIPEIFSEINIDYISDESILIKTPEINLGFNNKHFNISDNNQLFINFDVYKKEDQVIWNVRKLVFQEYDTDNYFLTYRYISPDKNLSEYYQKEWKDVLMLNHPFTEAPYIDDDGNSKIGTIHPFYRTSENIDEAFSIILCLEGKQQDEKMEDMLIDFTESFSIIRN